MSTWHATEFSRNEAARLSTWKNVGLWILQILTAAFFLMSGLSKIIGAPDMITLFEAVGIGQWFRIATGVLEILSAVLLVTPKLASLGASILMMVMLGAIFTHLFVIGGSPALPLFWLIMAAMIAWNRRETVITVWYRSNPQPSTKA